MTHRLAALLPFALSLVNLPAQLAPGFTHKSSLADVPYNLHSGQFERCEVIKSGAPKHYRDAIVLRGGQLGRIAAIGVWNWVEDIGFPGTATDIVRVPGTNPEDSSYDSVLIADTASGGVTFAWWTATQQPGPHAVAFQSRPLPTFQGAKQLTVSPTPAGYDLLGVAADGQTLVRAAVTGTNVIAGSSFFTGRTVISTVLGDRNGDGELESFCLTPIGVFIVSRAGTFVALVPTPHPGGALARIGNRVALVARNQADNGWQLSFVAGGDAFTTPAEITLHNGDCSVVGMGVAEVDQDGEFDVVITQNTTQEAMIARIKTDTAPILRVERQDVALSTQPLASGASNNCSAAIADLDGDGISDLIVPMQSSSVIAVCRGTADGQPYALTMDLLYGETYFDNDPATPDDPGLYLRLSNHQELFGQNSFSEVQVRLWKQDSASVPVDGIGVRNETYTIVPSLTASAQELFLPLWEGYDPDGYHHLEILFVDQNGELGPLFTVAGYTHQQQLTDPEWSSYRDEHEGLLLDYSLDGSAPLGIFLLPLIPQDPPDRILIGGHVRSAVMPPATPFPVPGPGGSTRTTKPV